MKQLEVKKQISINQFFTKDNRVIPNTVIFFKDSKEPHLLINNRNSLTCRNSVSAVRCRDPKQQVIQITKDSEIDKIYQYDTPFEMYRAIAYFLEVLIEEALELDGEIVYRSINPFDKHALEKYLKNKK